MFAAILWLTPGRSEVAVEAWVQRYNNPTDSNDTPRKIATDALGNVIVAGSSESGINGRNILVIKYSGDGTSLWTNRYIGPNTLSDDVGAVTVDASGNVFVAGYSYAAAATISDYVILGYSSAGTPLWTNFYNSPLNLEDRPTAITTDADGNVIVTGNSVGDYVTIKYSNAGAPLWTNRYDNLAADQAVAVAADHNGNVFVTGLSVGPTSSADYATIAYSSVGLPLWTNRYQGISNSYDAAYAIGVDSAGNVVVTGYSTDPVSSSDYTTIKYSNNGIPLWTNFYTGPGNRVDIARAIGIDDADNIFVTGESPDVANDYVTIKYSSEGTSVWTNRYSRTTNSIDYALALVLDSNDDVAVSGTSGTIKYSNAGAPLWTNLHTGLLAADSMGNFFVGATLTVGTNSDMVTIKLADTGIPLWTNRYTGWRNRDDTPAAVTVDNNGDIIVTGSSYSSSSSYSDYATIKYSSTGLPLWTNRYRANNALSEAKPTAVATDHNGNVFITGSVHGITGGSERPSEYVTIKYSNAGLPLWTNRYGGPVLNGTNQALGLAVDSVGNVFVTGASASPGTGLDYATIKYSNEGAPLWTNRYNGPGNRDDIPATIATDAAGNVTVTGSAYFSSASTAVDWVTIKYASNGATLWNNRYIGFALNVDQPTAIAIDGSNNVIVTGYTFSTGGSFFTTIKYSSAGTPLWTNRLAAGVGTANDIALDRDGNVYVTGFYYPLLLALMGQDYLTVKYSAAGVPLWTNRHNLPEPGGGVATAVAVDASGNVIVTGFTENNSGAIDFLTLGYSSTGAPLWTNRFNGPANGADVPQTKYSMAATADGVVIVGASDGDFSANANSDFVTVKYITTVKLSGVISNNAIHVSWPASHLGWRLEMQTNSLNIGLRTNWISVAGSTTTNRFSFPLTSTPRTAFFRLAR